MHSNDNITKYINIDFQMQIKKTVYLHQFNNNDNKKLSFPSQKKSYFEYADKINNCGSLYVRDFEIRQICEENLIKPKKCKFNILPENNFNPFLSYSKSNDSNLKKIIDIRTVQNVEEPDILLNDLLFQ